MRRDVEELRAFYASPLGRAVREAVGGRLAGAWGDTSGQDVLVWGYATPFAGTFIRARRVVAAMPARQGVEPWPASGRNRACLVPEHALPFRDALFDRVLVVHLLEESGDAAAVLADAARVLNASGRMVVVAAARSGLWSHVESTPFGHGRPYSRGQLERAVRAAGLEPSAWSRALYLPPWTPLVGLSELWEAAGARLWPGLGGLVMLEAGKRGVVVRPAQAAPAPRRRASRPVLAPAPALHGLAPPPICGIASPPPRRPLP